MGKHLDLGCGTAPRNPYRQEALFGIDIREGLTVPGVTSIQTANLLLEPIPFEESFFDSVSAYDFLEHIPRLMVDYANQTSHLPFIALMNEIWRVLKPDAHFYAVFPAFPHHLAFCDPTHVNILTHKSHRYFTGDAPVAAMYGFHGKFKLVRQHRIHPRGDYHPINPSLKLRVKMGIDFLQRHRSHLIWELQAIKSD